MRTCYLLVFAAACASGPDAPDATATPATPDIAVVASASAGDDGALIAGLSGFAIARAPNDLRCGGVAVSITRDVTASIPPDDVPLAGVLEIAFPTDLDFGDATRAQSVSRFEVWLTDLQQRGNAAEAVYRQQFTTAADARSKAIAAARGVQVIRHLANTLVHAEIPIDMRGGELAEDKRYAYCDSLAEAAEPLVKIAAKGAAECAKYAQAAGPGWWSSVCKP